MAIRNPSNAAALIVAAVATALASSAPSNASGNNSANTIQIIHPALKPTPNGIKLVNVSTNKNDGTAVTVCGNELMIDQNRHCIGFTPLLANTVDTAKPSGTLCTPMANVTKHPCAHPWTPEKLTPTPDPSPNECAVMIPTTSNVFRASAPTKFANDTSSCARKIFCKKAIKVAPQNNPKTTRPGPCGWPS